MQAYLETEAVFSLADVLRISDGTLVGKSSDRSLTFTGAETDSRRVAPGQLFVAYRGEHLDGHDFAERAVGQGATALLVERALPLQVPQIVVTSPRTSLSEIAKTMIQEMRLERVIGITGSGGKTTTRRLISGILEAAYPESVLTSAGGYNTDTGIAMSVLGTLRPGYRFAVFELGAQRAGEIAALCSIVHPDIGVVTSVGGAHLAFFGSLDGVAVAKSELPRALPKTGIAIVNGDDVRVAAMADSTAANVVRFGLSSGADCHATAFEDLGIRGFAFQWCSGQQQGASTTPLIGMHNLRNVLAAIAVAMSVGVDARLIDTALPAIGPTGSRLHPIPGPHAATILDDTYNANRPATIAALESIGGWSSGKRIAVLADMFELGTASETEHRLVGQAAAQTVDLLCTVGNDAQWIAETARQGGLAESQVARFPCDPTDAVALERARSEAADWLMATIAKGDIVLIKGARGMGMEHVVRHVTRSA